MILQIHIDVLRGLALKGCLDDFILLKTSELADWLGKSQQSASSYLIQLEKAGLIHRSYTRKASKIKITEAGRNVLLRRFSEYRRIFRPSGEKNKIRLTGTLETGFGEGAYYISLVHYQDQIKDKLGFEPYSGTFNIKLDLESIPALEALSSVECIRINGFTDKGRTFGSVNCHPCSIEGVEGAIIIPERTHYHDRVEVISPWFLREKLNKVENDRVILDIDIYPRIN
ncbi:MAG: DUF120 domain-containing protein [Candidatus Thermoplasmatota archaeon]|nr:DUF120 domain-containing protein [Candidatus Thermoplasmatota archaeon]